MTSDQQSDTDPTEPQVGFMENYGTTTLLNSEIIQNGTYCLKLTIAYRPSATPQTCTAVTFPYFLYSWNRPSRKLVSEGKMITIVHYYHEIAKNKFSKQLMYDLKCTSVFIAILWSPTQGQ